MAASLVEIKTRMLLPHDEKARGQNGEDDDDPVKTLQERLLQHEVFRNVAEHLQQMPQVGVEIQTNSEWSRLDPIYEHVEAPLTGESATLVVLYEQMLRDLVDRKHSKIEAKVHIVSVDEIVDRLEKEIDMTRFALFQGFYNRFQSRYELVVHTLAMLELVKMQRLKVYQQDNLGPIWMYRFDCDESILPLNQTTASYIASHEQHASVE